MSLSTGMKLGPYEILAPLGAGGMGEVYEARDPKLDRRLAIKVLPEAFANDPERLGRFEREAKILASLNHPNIAGVYGLHEDGGVHFLAMELVRGRRLTDEIAYGLTPGRVVELGVAITDALAAAHQKGVTHRDLKPDNIMVDDQGRPKVLDFGLAKSGPLGAPVVSLEASTELRPVRMTQEGSILGTVAYMSPEQAQGLPVDPRSDVFSLGVVLYEMTTGRRPFNGATTVSILSSILRDTPTPIVELLPSAPARLGQIVRRCLEKDPAVRYADASELRDDLSGLRADLTSDPGSLAIKPRLARRWIFAAGVLTVIVLAVLGSSWYRHSARERWLRRQALPKLESLVDRIQPYEEGRESWDAFLLARRIDEVAPGDPTLERLRPKFTREVSITSDPPGASVTATYYDEPDGQPIFIGRTPLEHVRYPRDFTRLRLTLEGHADVEDLIGQYWIIGDRWSYRFPNPGEVPDGMSFVPGGAFDVLLPGLDHLKAEPVAAFAMDHHEVTNREYKRFVDAGCYADPKYWRQPFSDTGRSLTFKEALSRFTDRTGRPGPATWEMGSYPEGQEEYPAAGLSWYEAAAYSEWAGKSLPTIFHWNLVAFTGASSKIVPLANFGGKGPVPVGSTRSMNRFAVSDLAGNVREWTWNESGRGQGRFILGGGWNDPDYAFNDAFAQPSFDRSPTNGFRCIRTLGQENLAALQRAIERPTRDFKREKRAADSVFSLYLRQFAYDKTPLNARIEEEKSTPLGVRQKITFNAAYGGERMMAYLFLPPAGKPPYQVVVIFPGSMSIDARSSSGLELGRELFFQKSGRAVLWPIYKGTYERGGDLHSDYPAETAFYKDYLIMWGKDLARSIDYLETRKDLDAGRIAYYGLSWGGALGAIMPAIEKRIKANVLYVAGLHLQRALPEADAINYVTRVTQPTLMLNGEHDFFFPPETSQRPMFELLGTPAADKKWLVFPGGHVVPRTEMIKQSLLWVDRYLGPPGSGVGP